MELESILKDVVIKHLCLFAFLSGLQIEQLRQFSDVKSSQTLISVEDSCAK